MSLAAVRAPGPFPERPRVLALADYFLPGYKAGGTLRTLANMADQLSDALEFLVLSRDRDLGDAAPYPGRAPGAWHPEGAARVRYLPPAERRALPLARAVRDARPDLLYLNSLFSPAFSVAPLLLRSLGRVPPVPVVIAPRGELSPGALRLKAPKKRVFLAAARASGAYADVWWQASSPVEADEVRRWFGRNAKVWVAPDLRERVAADAPPPPKRPGELNVAFLSRISRKKNLDGALRVLAGVRGPVTLTVYGPEEDARYAAECRALAATLPKHVAVDFAGPVPHAEVARTLRRHHLLLFPTHGENFGHVVLEALQAGCPVLLSDRTPWRRLEEAGAGWDLPLEAPGAFTAVLERVRAMDGEAHARLSRTARAYGLAAANDAEAVEANRGLFQWALGAAHAPGAARQDVRLAGLSVP